MNSVPIALTMSDGTLAVMRFITEGRGNILPFGAQWVSPGQWTRTPSPANLANEMARGFENHAVTPVSWRQIQESDVPTDRTFRGAWRDQAGAIKHDITQARQLVLDYVREWRKDKLADLDQAWMRAYARGDTTAAQTAEDQREVLRNLPQTLGPQLAAATTVAQLKALLQATLT